MAALAHATMQAVPGPVEHPAAPASGTVVVLPSLSFPVSELVKIKGVLHYEERLLCMLALLERPDVRVVFLTSMPVDPAVIDYYLGFLADPAGARRRLQLVAVGEDRPRPLTDKLLERPDVVDALRSLLPGEGPATVLPFNVATGEWRLAAALGAALDGPRPDLVPLGHKSGARRVARRAGVAVPDGEEDLRSLEELTAALRSLRRRHPGAPGAVVKLNNGFSGQGNALVAFGDAADAGDGPPGPVDRWPTTFCAAGETWSSFAVKVAAEGAIAEELVPRLVASPSVQLRISPGGAVQIVSTHDQLLAGPGGQVYLGCRFPAAAAYRGAIQEAALAVGRVLAADGVVGPFGIDFLVAAGAERGRPSVYLSEINLRMGGTTHPFWMARLVTRSRYDEATGELAGPTGSRCYIASDNLTSPVLLGRSPAEVIAAVADAGLAFDPGTGTGATLHLLGAVPGHGKLGATCIAPTLDEADALFARVSELVAAAPVVLRP